VPEDQSFTVVRYLIPLLVSLLFLMGYSDPFLAADYLWPTNVVSGLNFVSGAGSIKFKVYKSRTNKYIYTC
jgi:hypothetical protein